MIDIFHNYKLQREELLARIAEELQLDKTRQEKMETAYNAVYDLLKKDEDFFKDIEVEIYPQGSVRIGTTVKPINDEDFDLDTVMHIYDLYSKYSPTQIYNALVKVIEGNEYYKSIYEKKDRCVRLNYKSDFHMDILPACMPNLYEKMQIAIPEKKMQSWSSGNPKGFAEWFLNIANSIKSSMLKSYSQDLLEAKIESEPLPNDLYLKTPLQRSVQLVKRYRDIYYQNKDYRVSSIVLTTLMARFYNGEESIFDAINNITSRIRDGYLNAVKSHLRFKVLNPVNEQEDFTDSWTDDHYKSFYNFINDFYTKWQILKENFDISGHEYIEIFGEGVYKKSLSEQVKTFSKSSSDVITKANGIILGNSAFTDSKGQINETKGVKNEPHHNYGG